MLPKDEEEGDEREEAQRGKLARSASSDDISRNGSASHCCIDGLRSSSIDSVVCRICQSSSEELRLVSPCRCKGTMKYVHLECLEVWLNRSGLARCELCLHPFQTHESLRYGCCESLSVWYSNPDNRNLLLSDLMIYFIMSLVCAMLTMVCLLVLRFQGYEQDPFGEQVAKTAVFSFLVLIILAYIGNVLVMARDHIFPWYRWWKAAKCVRLSRLEVIRLPIETV
ncbi:E3 ubiquitin-protein ligase MARCHF2-like [Anopheles aquasalis]|uniref:E3 ubiquitin-protein ligase MARCHF2-like n=1 Tax=Anopheles aquasalis TaxID=42839 RepID=UPI00215ADF2F|nr:E3 ubiquitin-protein ligase MARCHF2-like [Anopheles aquasalis]